MTKKELKKYLNYNKKTGEFKWIKKTSNRVKIGDTAGTINNNGYVTIGLLGKFYKAHTLAWLYCFGKFPKYQIDHIDGNPSCNKILNLRDVPQSENCKNRKIRSNNTSGYTGVTYAKVNRKWKAFICIDGVQTSLGYFKKKEDAIKERIKNEKIYGYHKNHGRK